VWTGHILGAVGTSGTRPTPPSNRRAYHLEKMHMDLDYWTTITYQERNNNRYLKEELGVIRRVACCYISIIDTGIQLSHLKLLYY
jgi:hypothetical protein